MNQKVKALKNKRLGGVKAIKTAKTKTVTPKTQTANHTKSFRATVMPSRAFGHTITFQPKKLKSRTPASVKPKSFSTKMSGRVRSKAKMAALQTRTYTT